MHRALALVVLATAVVAGSAPALAQPALQLRRVLLSTGGVGYFEHEAVVDGDAELPLSVRLAQVDDVLKSVVVYDDRGGVGAISLPGREPLSQVFRDLPFGGDALQSPASLLRALVGAEVRVRGARTLEGRLLAVTPEDVLLPDGLGRTTRHRVSVVVPEEGLRQFVLEEADQVELVDPALRVALTGALAGLSRHRVQDRRTLRVAVKGAGRRVVRVGYVVEAPLWKTSYRLTMPAPGGPPEATGQLQGWAVLENLSGQDWQGVELVLASGSPVTFRQALYTAYYATRPEVPVEVMGRILPRVDPGVVQGEPREQAAAAAPAPAAARRAPPPGAAGALRAEAAPGTPPPAASTAEEGVTQVLFRVAEPVTVATGSSLVLPIVSRPVPVTRLALFDAGASTAHPLAAVRLTNDGDSALPPGVLTLYEDGPTGGTAYVGDARLGALPPGERRLLSFALDQKVQVSRETRSREAVAGGRLSRGVLELTTLDQQTTVYRLRGPAAEPRLVVLEHPRPADWRLAAPSTPGVELTRDRYRIPVALAPGQETQVEVVLERPRVSRIELRPLPAEALAAYARTGALDERVRKAFEALAALRGDVDREERDLAELERSRQALGAEQERLRANLAAVPATSDLRQRYLDRLRQQEDQIEALQARTEATRTRLAAARERLADAIAALDF
jgi:hypothetical protein